MDIIKELDHLPTFAYTFYMGGKYHLALLGGHSCKPLADIEHWSTIIDMNDEMQAIYEKEKLEEADKIRLARLMTKVSGLCEGRLENNRTLEQQAAYLASLTNDALDAIKIQIQMYKDAQEYYRLYLA